MLDDWAEEIDGSPDEVHRQIDKAANMTMALYQLASGKLDISYASKFGYDELLTLDFFFDNVIKSLVILGGQQTDLLGMAYCYQAAVVLKLLLKERREKQKGEN